MAGGVAQATNTGHPRKAPQQCAERRGRAGLVLAVIGIHVLPDQRHLAHACPGEPLDFGRDLLHRPRHFDAARIGHDAEGAELVAAFLHGDEGGNAAAADRLVRGGSQRVELVLQRKFGIDDLLAALRARDQAGQAVKILRADDQVDAGAAGDFLAFGLRHTAGNGDQHLAALCRRVLLHFADAADLGIDLVHRLLADVAGIQDDEIGLGGIGGFAVAGRRQRVRHTIGIVDVHLAAEGLDVDFAEVALAAQCAARIRTMGLF